MSSSTPTPDEVIRAIAEKFGLTVSQVTGPRKWRSYVEARYQISVRLRSLGLSTPQIGRLLRRDHSTIVSLLKGGKAKDLTLTPAAGNA